MEYLVYPLYIVALAALVFLSMKIGDYVDLLDKKTKVSGALIGGVLLAAVTSLPELFTSISAVLFVRDPSLVGGDILGSNIFDLAALLLLAAIFIKGFLDAKISKWQCVVLGALLLMYSFCTYALAAPEGWQVMLGDINLMSLFIIAIYVILMVCQPKKKNDEEKLETAEEEKPIKGMEMSVKKIVILFTICAVLLISVSIGITYLTDMITDQIDWLNGTVGGAILLGIATSIPEVISTTQLFRHKNYETGFANMIGSTTFNFMVLGLMDLISWKPWNGDLISLRGIFISNPHSIYLSYFALGVVGLTLAIILLKNYTKLFEKKKMGIPVTFAIAAGALTCYLLPFFLG